MTYTSQNQWVSLKIMTANSLKSLELQSLRLLSSKYIVQLLNDFTYGGPYRVCRCLIFELLGPIVYIWSFHIILRVKISSSRKNYFECPRNSQKLSGFFIVLTLAVGISRLLTINY
ncbi:hypothetical protein N7471_009166 [Penicillium samsonianum]|uniref:uncharacterized protein n=1 Tax=Penicillium samsonianum TaxID=1882272 RepID=UPI00254757A1|nr:uncharacterized protein N7471_009166 [Penicillium samsonianum]KAJ6127949.1 hypothetical protein N7471_009166 [Penicillium samsonianum]